MEDMDVNAEDADPFQKCLAEAAYAIRCGFHATHGHSPGELVFGRNMFLPVDTSLDWKSIQERKQKAIAKSNRRENSKRVDYKYQKGDWITIRKPGILRKLSVPKAGPYKVVKHNTNGTLAYEKGPFDVDEVSIRRVEPCHWKHPPETQ